MEWYDQREAGTSIHPEIKMSQLANLSAPLAGLVQRFTRYPTTQNHQRAAAAWLALLYMIGGLAWGYFFAWGKVDANFHDWAAITAPRLTFLKDAVTRLELPLHISDPSTLDYITDRYLSVPDAFIAPQTILLRWMDVGTFVMVDALLLYTCGFWGLLLVRRRFRLSAAAFTILFLLFNFNGHILAHYSVGHATWGGYFLFPFFVLGVVELFDGGRGWGWVARMALVMGAIYLQGSFHQFVWLLILLGLIGVCIPRYFWMSLKAAAFSVAVGLFRILPPVLLVDKFNHRFIAGYPTLEYLWRALVEVAVPGDITLASGMTSAVGWWELTLYIGLLGALFLLGFGLVGWLGARRPALERRLLLPLGLLTLLAMGNIYAYIQQVPVPLFTGERISARMLSVVLVFLLVAAAAEFQRRLDEIQHATWVAAGAILGLAFMAQDLWQNLRLWKVASARALFPTANFSPADWYVHNNYNDGGYIALVGLGLALSAAALALLAFLSLRERRRRSAQPANA